MLLTAGSAALPAGEAAAQWALSLQQMSVYDDNSWAFNDKRADVYHQTFVAASTDLSGDYSFTQLFYYGGAALFRTYSTRTYHQHTLGAYYQLQLDHRGEDDEEEEKESAEALPGFTEEETAEDEVAEEDTSTASFQEEESADEESDADSVAIDEEDETEGDIEETAEPDDGEEQGDVVQSRDPVLADTVRVSAMLSSPPASPPESPSALPPDSLVTYLILKPMIGARFDREEFDFYDHRRAGLDATLRRSLPLGIMGRLQYDIEYVDYPNLRQFTHLEHEAVVTLNRRLGEPVELFFSAAYGYKSYLETIDDTTLNTIGGGKGKGKGNVKKQTQVVTKLLTPAAAQWTLAAGLNGPLAGGVWSLSYLRRLNPDDNARFLDPRVLEAGTEDQIFDDRYGYQGDEIGVTLQTQVFGTLVLTLQGEYHRKMYPRAATDLLGVALPGEPQRIDLRFGSEFQAMFPLVRTAAGTTSLSLGASYSYRRNQSNDQYHDYSINQISLILEAAL